MPSPGPDETTGAHPGAADGRSERPAFGAPHALAGEHRGGAAGPFGGAAGRCGAAVGGRPGRGAAGRSARAVGGPRAGAHPRALGGRFSGRCDRAGAARPGGPGDRSVRGVRGRAGGVTGAVGGDATDGTSGSRSGPTPGGNAQATLRRTAASLSAVARPGLVPRRGARPGEGAR
ncbi:DUF6380 family protein [Streptomyces pharetrae]|uniref:DUF6380 family protein n=1 Tax=Streptomyces pharetrae TaxID=291370 RepID=UPI00335C150F